MGYLRKEKSVIVTSLIDYFRLPGDFPDYEEVTALHDVVQIVTGLEAGLKKDIGHPLFLPYIQLHEFEALLFTNIKGFVDVAEISPKKSWIILDEIHAILDAYDNPEDINDQPETAPSKRLCAIIPGYEKVLHGFWIAEENGLQSIIEKCPRFRHWLKAVIKMAGE